MEHQKVEQIQIEKECQVVRLATWHFYPLFKKCPLKFIGLYVVRQYIIFIFDSTRVIILPTQTMRYYSGTPPKSTHTFAACLIPPKIHCFYHELRWNLHKILRTKMPSTGATIPFCLEHPGCRLFFVTPKCDRTAKLPVQLVAGGGCWLVVGWVSCLTKTTCFEIRFLYGYFHKMDGL